MARLAYILSASHSGSTLLAMLLGAHPKAVTVGELKADIANPDNYRCSCGQTIHDCEFWTKVRESMRAKGFADFDITRAGTSIFGVKSKYAHRLLAPMPRSKPWELMRDTALSFSGAWRSHLRSTQARNAALIDTVAKIADADVVVDSSKMPIRLKYLLRNPDIDIKVIRFVRDGRAVSLTYTDEWNYADASDPTLRGGGTGQKRASPWQHMADAAREWRRSNESADCVIADLQPSQYLRVRYEDVCSDPRGTLERICIFLGLDPKLINLEFRSKPQHVVGNGMRLDTSSTIRVDDRWRTALTAEQLADFDRVAGDLNRACGYV